MTQAIIYDVEFQQNISSLYQINEDLRSPNEDISIEDHKSSEYLKSISLFCSGNSNQPNKVVQEKIRINEEMHLSKAMDLDFEIENSTNTTPSSTLKAISDSIRFSDNLFYIYTSGTTGLPKAAIIKHSRFILASIMCKHVMGLRENDVLYTAGLPLYHTLGRSISPSNFLNCVLFHILRINMSFKQSNLIINILLQPEWLPFPVAFVPLGINL